MSPSARLLPGCRSDNDDQFTLKIDFKNFETSLNLELCREGVSWGLEISKTDGKLLCNLQELTVLKWIVQDNEDSEAAATIQNCTVRYRPERRYPCIYPHLPGEMHSVLEMPHTIGTIHDNLVAGDPDCGHPVYELGLDPISMTNLLEMGEEAIREQSIILCPIPPRKSPWQKWFKGLVHVLAARWPCRQMTCAQAVRGMIDLTPVDICGQRSGDSDCVTLKSSNTDVMTLPKDIKASRPRDGLLWVLRSLQRKMLHINVMLHSSWRDEILDAAQPCVFNHQGRKATTWPTRVWDIIEDRAVEGPVDDCEHFLTVSYRCADWGVDSLKARLAVLARRLKARYFWVDSLCIEEGEKQKEIPKMEKYYGGASACLVLVGTGARPFACLPMQTGVITSAFQQVWLNREALDSFLQSSWGERVWTVQESLLPRQVIYSVADQLIDGDYVSELMSYLDTGTRRFLPNKRENSWYGGYGCYRWTPGLPAIIAPRSIRVKNGTLRIIRSVYGGEEQRRALLQPRHPDSIAMPFEEALALVTNRNATHQSDYIYGILGLTQNGELVPVELNITWEKMLVNLSNAGMITARQLASTTAHTAPGKSWLPAEPESREPTEQNWDVYARQTPGFGPFMQMEILAGPLTLPKLQWCSQGATVSGVVFEWLDYKIDKFPTNSRHGMPCQVAYGFVCFPDTPEVTAHVCAMSSGNLTPETFAGMHLLLHKELIPSNHQAVAIQVEANNMAERRVRRRRGYILDGFEWFDARKLEHARESLLDDRLNPLMRLIFQNYAETESNQSVLLENSWLVE